MTDQSEFRVSWDIDLTAESPKQAVRMAVDYLTPSEPARWCYRAIDTQTREVSEHEGEELF